MPTIAHRSLGQVIRAAGDIRHYRALIHMAFSSGNFSETLGRYLFGKGEYPFSCPVKTPLGDIHPTLYSYYDLLTLNEIFFRHDYPAGPSDKVIVDIGSNIGISALYFLTRHPSSTCYLFEPDPRNIQRLRLNLTDFLGRWNVSEKAVADKAGSFQFGLDENSGRYGGLNVNYGKTMTVEVLHINTVLKEVIGKHGGVDILKVDTEGSEIATIQAIDSDLLKKVRKIYIEATPENRLLSWFNQVQSGTVCRLENQKIS